MATMPTSLPANRAAGALWMVASGVAFLGVNGIVKYIGTALPASEAALLRYLFGGLILLPTLRSLLRDRPSARAMQLFVGRGVMHSFGVGLWFYRVAQVPIAEVQAISYLPPVLVTVGGDLSWRASGAAPDRCRGGGDRELGVILRPGFHTVTLGEMALVAVAFSFAGSYLVAKRLTEVAESGVIVAMLSIWVTIWLAPLALEDWVPPALPTVLWLAVTAAFASAGHYRMTQAFRHAR